LWKGCGEEQEQKGKGEQWILRIKLAEQKISGTSSLSAGKKIKGRREGDKWMVIDKLRK